MVFECEVNHLWNTHGLEPTNQNVTKKDLYGNKIGGS